jgi:hypothetical protein
MKRPYRLEKEGLPFDVPTYASEEGARKAAEKLPPGQRWKIVVRRTRRDRHVVAEGCKSP